MFYGHPNVEEIEITTFGSATREFLNIDHGVVASCKCGWHGDLEYDDLSLAKEAWALIHMGMKFMPPPPMTESEKEASRKRKQELVDRFTRM